MIVRYGRERATSQNDLSHFEGLECVLESLSYINYGSEVKRVKLNAFEYRQLFSIVTDN